MPQIFICGEALIDFVPFAGGEGYAPKPGGSPFNAAKAAAMTGARTRFVGALSTDFFGDRLARELAEAGVDRSLVARSDDPTTLAFVDLASGDPRYAFFNKGSANANMDPNPQALSAKPGDLLHVGSISLIDPPAADRIAAFALAARDRLMLSVDPNARPGMMTDPAAWQHRIEGLLDAAAVVKLSTDDLATLAPGLPADDFAARLLDGGPELVVVTDGTRGATAYTRRHRQHCPAPEVDVADTVGAGDVLTGALLSRLAASGIGDPASLARIAPSVLADLLRFATAAAALNCQRHGCAPPTTAEIETALDSL